MSDQLWIPPFLLITILHQTCTFFGEPYFYYHCMCFISNNFIIAAIFMLRSVFDKNNIRGHASSDASSVIETTLQPSYSNFKSIRVIYAIVITWPLLGTTWVWNADLILLLEWRRLKKKKKHGSFQNQFFWANEHCPNVYLQ
jgi:hypothetical protein